MSDYKEKPSHYPEFASEDVRDQETGQLNAVAPPRGRKSIGWQPFEEPPRQWLNWLLRVIYRWIRHFDETRGQLETVDGDLPDAGDWKGRILFYENEGVPVFSDGERWRKVTDGESV